MHTIEAGDYLPPLSEEARVLLWRAETLERAGYDRRSVITLAFNKDVDLHRAVSLLERGCPTGTALRILV